MYRTIVEAVLAHGTEQPDHLAVAFKKNTVTYGELCQQVRNMASILHEQYHVEKGDFIMLSAISKPEYAVAYLAIQYLNAVSIPVDKSAKVENILDIYNFVHPKLILLDGKILGEGVSLVSLKGLYADAQNSEDNYVPDYKAPSDDSLSEILFTTGTTGKPKGGMLSIGNIYASTIATVNGIGMKDSDCILIPLPLQHSFGMRVMRASLYIGATVILQNGFTFAKELENNLNAYHCSGFVSTPASLELIYRQMQDKFPEIMGRLRYIEVSTGSLSAGMKRKMVSLLPDTEIMNTWGSTETGGAIFLNISKCPDKLESIGKPFEGIEFKAVDDDGNAVEARDVNTAGRMALKGQMAMMGYFGMPELTAKTLDDGWLYTSDLVYEDEDGYIYMLGRADDIINVGGEKVSPIEVENIASEFEDVRECACVGVKDPDDLLGQVPILYVVPEENTFDEKGLIRYLADNMEKYKMPHQYINISELPRNKMNKIDRRALTELWDSGINDDVMNDSISNILSRRSVRVFRDERIPKEKLDMIIQCGYYAPSGHNMQTWRFTVVQDKNKIEEFKTLVSRVAKENKVYFYGFNNPDVLIIVSNDRRNRYAIQDSSCAAENMMLAANSYGIGSVWIQAVYSICDEPDIRKMLSSFGIPEEHIVVSTIAMGYPLRAERRLEKKTDVVRWI